MSQWYYNKGGQAHGPLKIEAIGEQIQAGEIGPLDLVFQVGTTEWKALSQVPELQSYMEAEELAVEEPPEAPGDSPSESPEWVLLKKVTVDGQRQFKQMGPYKKSQVVALLDSGKVLFQDFIWKAGMEEWLPISQVEAFKSPLPSAPPIETVVYQAQVDKAAAAPSGEAENEDVSLTELVEIETYQREKTQMVSAEQLRKQWVKEDSPNAGAPASAVETGDSDGGDLWSLVPPETGSDESEPAVQVAAETDVDSGEDEQNPLLSLHPRNRDEREDKNYEVTQKIQATEIGLDSERGSVAQGIAPETAVASKSVDAEEDSFWEDQPEDQPGLAGFPLVKVGAVFAGVLFVFLAFYMLFSGGDEDSNIAEGRPGDTSVASAADAPEPDEVNESDEQEVRQLKEKLQAFQAQEAERKRELERAREKRRQAVVKREEEVAAASRKKSKASERNVASVKKTEPRAQPKPKAKPKPKPKRLVGGVPRAISGSARAKSFYKQRDRKALFYTALDAERLVTDLETSYRDLKRNKAGWKKFYRGWKSRLRNSAPALVRNFPNSREDYAYPKELATLKKDYALLKDYGDLHNAKVLGLRIPASPGKNLTQVFSRLRSKAKGLGR